MLLLVLALVVVDLLLEVTVEDYIKQYVGDLPLAVVLLCLLALIYLRYESLKGELGDGKKGRGRRR